MIFDIGNIINYIFNNIFNYIFNIELLFRILFFILTFVFVTGKETLTIYITNYEFTTILNIYESIIIILYNYKDIYNYLISFF
jgi:hypothetical protein